VQQPLIFKYLILLGGLPHHENNLIVVHLFLKGDFFARDANFAQLLFSKPIKTPLCTDFHDISLLQLLEIFFIRKRCVDWRAVFFVLGSERFADASKAGDAVGVEGRGRESGVDDGGIEYVEKGGDYEKG
jgi:hypothetical protein